MNRKDIMMDIETIGLDHRTTILSIGLVKFNPFSMELPTEKLYIKLDPLEQKKLGRTISKGTLEWWSKQDPKVREEAFGPEGQLSVRDGLNKIVEFFNDNIECVWGQGYGFDMTKVGTLFVDVDIITPWKFYQERDSRTLFSLLPEDPRPSEGKDLLHNALSDAYYQAIGVQRAFKIIYGL